MSRPRTRHLQRALRGRRRVADALVRDRRDRLAVGPEVAAARERALMGALLLRPRLIRAFARQHPPGWFTDAAALHIMRALFCASAADRIATVDDLIDSLRRHGTLELAGGEDAVRALARSGPALEVALREVEALGERLPPEKQEEIHRAETMDALDELLEHATSAAPTAGGNSPQLKEPEHRQLELFQDEEADVGAE